MCILLLFPTLSIGNYNIGQKNCKKMNTDRKNLSVFNGKRCQANLQPLGQRFHRLVIGL